MQWLGRRSTLVLGIAGVLVLAAIAGTLYLVLSTLDVRQRQDEQDNRLQVVERVVRAECGAQSTAAAAKVGCQKLLQRIIDNAAPDQIAALRGAPGADGEDGADGTDGATGPRGATGRTGPAGATGARGGAGPRGATGAPGATGPAGSPGGVGPRGPVGPTGPQGPQGPQGRPGVSAGVGVSVGIG